jgi:glycosyltransferase involved in cell wall biosynthesis
LSIGGQVKFLGPLYGQDKIIAFESAEAFVLPSVSEGMPLAILEAWAYKLPVIMTPQCNIEEGFVAGAAIRAEPRVVPLAAGLETLFVMSDLDRTRMGNNGQRLVQRAYTWGMAAERMQSVYGWLVGGSSRPDCVVTDQTARHYM